VASPLPLPRRGDFAAFTVLGLSLVSLLELGEAVGLLVTLPLSAALLFSTRLEIPLLGRG
jgi:hypothetical protein